MNVARCLTMNVANCSLAFAPLILIYSLRDATKVQALLEVWLALVLDHTSTMYGVLGEATVTYSLGRLLFAFFHKTVSQSEYSVQIGGHNNYVCIFFY